MLWFTLVPAWRSNMFGATLSLLICWVDGPNSQDRQHANVMRLQTLSYFPSVARRL